jgi:hypothetical protein
MEIMAETYNPGENKLSRSQLEEALKEADLAERAKWEPAKKRIIAGLEAKGAAVKKDASWEELDLAINKYRNDLLAARLGLKPGASATEITNALLAHGGKHLSATQGNKIFDEISAQVKAEFPEFYNPVSPKVKPAKAT